MNQRILNILLVLIVTTNFVGAVSIDYPALFQEKETEIIVGENAARSDYQSALELADDLSFISVIRQETIRNAFTENIPLGKSITSKIDNEINSYRIKDLQNKKINFQGSNYNIKDLLLLGQLNKNVKVQTSLTGHQDYVSDPVLEVEKNAIKFFHNFGSSIDLKKAELKNPLELNFLGKLLKITRIDSDNKFTAQVGTSYFMNVGDSISLDTKRITLKNVDTKGSILIDISGEVKPVPPDSTRLINELQIGNEENFYTKNVEDRAAIVIIGKNVQRSFENGDPYLGEDKNKPRWIWNIGNLQTVASSNPDISGDGTGPFIGIRNNFIIDDPKDNPIRVGNCINLPEEYIGICFDELINAEYQPYRIEIEKSTDLSKIFGEQYSKTKTIKISAAQSDGLVVKATSLSIPELSSNKRTKEIWLYATNNDQMAVLYKDTAENKIKLAGYISDNNAVSMAEISYGKTKKTNIEIETNFSPNNNIKVVLKPSSPDLNDFSDNIELKFRLDEFKIISLGDTESTSEASELKWNNVEIGIRNKDALSKYGIIIKNPFSEGSNGRVKLEIPKGEVKAKISVKGPEKIELTTIERTLLRTPKVEISNNYLGLAETVILIGGPCANPITSDFFVLTCQGWELNEGQAIIKIKEVGDKRMLLIAGTTAQDTIDAVKHIMENKEALRSVEEAVITL